MAKSGFVARPTSRTTMGRNDFPFRCINSRAAIVSTSFFERAPEPPRLSESTFLIELLMWSRSEATSLYGSGPTGAGASREIVPTIPTGVPQRSLLGEAERRATDAHSESASSIARREGRGERGRERERGGSDGRRRSPNTKILLATLHGSFPTSRTYCAQVTSNK
eukprot:scaffold58308_cov32-Tisochrysis_lutea.AAC.4